MNTLATITQVGNHIEIASPFNRSFVQALKQTIPPKERGWNGSEKVWEVSNEYAEQAEDIVRQFYTLDGEENTQVYEIIEAVVKGGNTRQRSYPGGVTIDGCDVINMRNGHIVWESSTFTVVEIVEDGFDNYFYSHAFTVEYQVKLRCRKGAEWNTYGNCHKHGQYEILSQEEE